MFITEFWAKGTLKEEGMMEDLIEEEQEITGGEVDLQGNNIILLLINFIKIIIITI